MMSSGTVRSMGKRLREFAGWFVDPPTLARRVTIRMTVEELRALRLCLDRGALLIEAHADHLAREEGKRLEQVEGEQWRITERKRQRASELADALLEDQKYELR